MENIRKLSRHINKLYVLRLGGDKSVIKKSIIARRAIRNEMLILIDIKRTPMSDIIEIDEISKKIRKLNFTDVSVRFNIKTVKTKESQLAAKSLFKRTFTTNAKNVHEFTASIWETIKAQREFINAEVDIANLHIRAKLDDGTDRYVTFPKRNFKDLGVLFEAIEGGEKFREDFNKNGSDWYDVPMESIDLSYFALIFSAPFQSTITSVNIDTKAGARPKFIKSETYKYHLLDHGGSRNNCLLKIVKMLSYKLRKSSYKKIRKDIGMDNKSKIDVTDNEVMKKLQYLAGIRIIVRNIVGCYETSHKYKLNIHVEDGHAYQCVDKKYLHDDGDVKRFIFYDFESITCYMRGGKHIPFSVAWFVVDEEQNIITAPTFYIGYDCVKKFYDFVSVNFSKYRSCIIGFNNSAYDDYFLLDHLLENDVKPYTTTFQNRIFMRWEKFSSFDIFKHITPTSLKKFCEDFKLKNAKLSDHKFRFTELNLMYNNLGPKKFLKWVKRVHGVELKEYNIYDVLSIKEGFFLLRKMIEEHGFGKLKIEKFMTTGQIAKKQLKLSWGNKSYSTTFKNILDYNEIRSSAIAGISYSAKKWYKRKTKKNEKRPKYPGVKNKDIIFTEMYYLLIDVVSQYPYVMSHKDNYYPYGKYHRVSKFINDKLGIYRVTNIDQSILLDNINIVPIKKEGEPYDYDSKEIIESVMLCSVDIKRLMKYKCKFEIKYGYVWDLSESGREIFGPYMDKFAKLKNDEDIKKMLGKPFHTGKRNTAKILLNVQSGKVMQRFKYEKISGIFYKNNDKSFYDFWSKCAEDSIEISAHSNHQYVIISGKVPIHELYLNKKIENQNMLLGIFLYAYARRDLYDNLLYNKSSIRVETDSAIIGDKHLAELNKKFITSVRGKIIPLMYNGIGQKYFGQLEIELDKITECITPEKKTGYVEHSKGIKKTFKGLSKRWISVTQKFADLCPSKNKYKREYIYRDKLSWADVLPKGVLSDKFVEKYRPKGKRKLFKRNANEKNDQMNWLELCEWMYDCPHESCLTRENYLKKLGNQKIHILQSMISKTFHRTLARKGDVALRINTEYRIKSF